MLLNFFSYAGTGLSPVPVQMMTLVTMATSQEGMVNQVLHDIMQVERPEFQAQKHSSDADSLQHLRDLKQEQVISGKRKNVYRI